jgi:transposase
MKYPMRTFSMYFGQNIILQLKIDRKAGYRLSDNATFHVSRKTKQFIENQLHWLTVIFLPKRSPNLNPVETRVNRNLKKDVCANHNYGTEKNLMYAVRRYLRCIGSWPKL